MPCVSALQPNGRKCARTGSSCSADMSPEGSHDGSAWCCLQSQLADLDVSGVQPASVSSRKQNAAGGQTNLMKRPSSVQQADAAGASMANGQSKASNKSVEEQELDYQKARERILGSTGNGISSTAAGSGDRPLHGIRLPCAGTACCLTPGFLCLL